MDEILCLLIFINVTLKYVTLVPLRYQMEDSSIPRTKTILEVVKPIAFVKILSNILKTLLHFIPGLSSFLDIQSKLPLRLVCQQTVDNLFMIDFNCRFKNN